MLHGQSGHIAGTVSIWNPETKESYISQLTQHLDTRVRNKEGVKLYIVYKGLTPPEPALLHPLREQHLEVIPISSARMEEAIYTQKYVETLKELEEPFITRKDPYAESKPIGDPTWFYGRDKMMSRIPAVLAQGQHIGVFGLRKVGKTSLLKQIRQRFVEVPTAYIDCQGYSYSAMAYFETILRQIHTELKMRKIGRLSDPDKVFNPEDFQNS
ncbi:MAG: ATP-binding protein [Desulfobacteraceae bacterium]|nr:ATP-binding protein [Desulfobacteraceae bacterium]